MSHYHYYHCHCQSQIGGTPPIPSHEMMEMKKGSGKWEVLPFMYFIRALFIVHPETVLSRNQLWRGVSVVALHEYQ